ncbi:MAG: hypothetical protein LBI99_02565, partial [Propionibacteriaceae bacterium]|nr:hypothetical protein [Propionibacteriaceae bacterium]
LKKITPDWNSVQLVNSEKQAEPTKALVQAASAVTDAPRFATINADMNQALMDALAEVAAGKATPQQAAETLKTQQETVG